MRAALSCAATKNLLHRSSNNYLDLKQGNRPWADSERVTAMLHSVLHFLQSWRRYNISLRQLSHLDDRQLADIGISRSDIPRIAWAKARN
jgi:uncharacterized protein YjiS (DUF1127 family)